jgi:lipoprotein-anchoring transpeptidase ErfK/SrfK
LYGADEKETPQGTFRILSKAKDHSSSVYDARMPFTLRLTHDGIAIHGSDVRWGAATHGCVGVPTEFARLLFERAVKGDEVRIMRSREQST